MVNVRVEKTDAVDRVAKSLKADALFMRTALSRIDQDFRKNEAALFSTEGVSGGARWSPLSPAYAERKARMRRADQKFRAVVKGLGGKVLPIIAGNKILTLGGGLRESLSKPGGSHVAYAQGTSLFLGTSYPLAHYHYEGRAPLPRRDPIQHKPEQSRAYLGTIRDMFIERTRKIILASVRRG